MEQENTYSWHQQLMPIVLRQIVTSFIFSLPLQSMVLNGEYEWMKKIWVLWLLKITDWRYVWGSIATLRHSQQTKGPESSWRLHQRDLAACPGGKHNVMAPKCPSHDWNECSTCHVIGTACRRCIAFQQIGQLISCICTVALRGLMTIVDIWAGELSFLGTWTCRFLRVSTALY